MGSHICFNIQEDCLNCEESYGEICVGCNACGRLNKETMLPDRLATFKRHLEAAKAYASAVEGIDEHQKNIFVENVKYYEQAIRKVKEEMEGDNNA
ncbi:MAG: hypothetical protein GX963_04680 [Bacteroidales bacterium]|nr:hypothetical protein [Bacteroidales bacterium]